MDVREHAGQAVSAAIAEALMGKQALLVLDNAEHLLPRLAGDLADLLTACPTTLRLLVTSRERLQIAAETSWPVPPLAAGEGELLFVERARAAGVELTVDDTIRDLCHRLDQLPLAIELAAARTPLFHPAGLLDRVGSYLDLLRGHRDSDPRQATLRATIDWSYSLLAPAERRLFEALSVFVGGCLYEAACDVAGADPETLQSLIDKSLLRRRDSRLGPRYWMLETVREYASERLSSSGEEKRAAERHALYYGDTFAHLAQQLRERDASAVLRADQEAGNIQRGVESSITSGRADVASLYFFGLWAWMVFRGVLQDAHRQARAYIELDLESLDPSTRFAGQIGIGEIFRRAGDREAAIRIKRRMLEELPAVSDVQLYGRLLGSMEPALLTDLAHLELDTREIDAALLHAKQALAIRRKIGHPWGIAHALNPLVSIARVREDFQQARALQAEVVALTGSSRLIPVEAVEAELVLAELELLCAEPAEARERLLNVDVGEIVRDADPSVAAEALRVFATWLEADGRLEEAAFLFGAFEKTQQESGSSIPGHLAERADALATALRRQLGEARFALLTAEGAASPALDLVAGLPMRLVRAEPLGSCS
jgi:predicted ATPase